ncbi:MAG TPA: hypothetical protein VL418_05530 [Devosiaceae bacterium]|nr:hypothetical protein [Devosiaceae bacterium]
MLVTRIAALAALLLLGACARPVGDFGRADPDIFHDSVMPALGQTRAALNSEPVSTFNKSDAEVEMANRIWRFVTSGRTKDWFMDIAAELHRTRVAYGTGIMPTYDRYYNWLHGTAYRSSEVRYATMAADVGADLDTIPDTFASICEVRVIDHQRLVARNNMPVLDTGSSDNVDARIAENEDQIGWFVRALRYRYDSYNYALDHLLVETPDPAAKPVNEEITALGLRVRQAETGAFCAPPQFQPDLAAPYDGPVIPSRYSQPSPAGS